MRFLLRRGVASYLAILTACIAAFPSAAYAYLDPGTGSMILQLIIGGVAGAMVVLKLYWHKLKQFVTGGGRGGDDAETGDATR